MIKSASWLSQLTVLVGPVVYFLLAIVIDRIFTSKKDKNQYIFDMEVQKDFKIILVTLVFLGLYVLHHFNYIGEFHFLSLAFMIISAYFISIFFHKKQRK